MQPAPNPEGPIPIAPDPALDTPRPATRPHAPKCAGCGYNLTGLPHTANCPECGKPVAESLGVAMLLDNADPNAILAIDKYCITCGYNLRGARRSANCSECGTPVMDSLRGNFLQFASREWLVTLRKGLSLVLNGILLMIVVSILTAIIGAVGASMGIPGLQVVAAGLSLGVSLMIAWGYWNMTQPDPSIEATEKVQSSRQITRVVVATQLAIALINFVLQGIIATGVLVNTGAQEVVLIIAGLLGFASMLAWIVQFVCVMNYMAWLGSRVPDAWIQRRAKKYRWLLPVIAVVGAIALFLGPLIALVMYWNLLDRLRKHCKSIEKTGQPAQLKKMAAMG